MRPVYQPPQARLEWLRFIFVNFLAHGEQVTTCSLSGEREALIWRVDGEHGAPHDGVGTLTLWTLILDRTGLRLRDLSVEAHIISAKAAPHLAPVSGTAGRAQKPGIESGLSVRPPVGAMATATQGSELAQGGEVKRRFKTLGIIGSPAILLVVASLVLMLAQRPYFEWQCAQSHSHAPRYTSSLAQSDGLWSALPYTRFNNGALEFIEDTSYEPMIALLQPSPQDGLYEVTTTIAQGLILVARDGPSSRGMARRRQWSSG
jgi:hypothetical protein